MSKQNKFYPFDSASGGMAVSVADRLHSVKNYFGLEECRAALKNKNLDLQASVRTAIERKIRKLEKQQS